MSLLPVIPSPSSNMPTLLCPLMDSSSHIPDERCEEPCSYQLVQFNSLVMISQVVVYIKNPYQHYTRAESNDGFGNTNKWA